MLCGFGQCSDLTTLVRSIVLSFGTLFAVKRQITVPPLASVETYRIRKNLNLQSSWMYNIKMEANLIRPEMTQGVRFYPLRVYVFRHLIER